MINTSFSIEELRNLPQDEPFICLFSGGKDCGLALRMPLWELPHETLLFEMEQRGMKIITSIDDTKLSPDFLGMTFDRNTYNAFLELGIDPFGENGEFHTTFANADYFKKALNYKIKKKSNSLIELQVM